MIEIDPWESLPESIDDSVLLVLLITSGFDHKVTTFSKGVLVEFVERLGLYLNDLPGTIRCPRDKRDRKKTSCKESPETHVDMFGTRQGVDDDIVLTRATGLYTTSKHSCLKTNVYEVLPRVHNISLMKSGEARFATPLLLASTVRMPATIRGEAPLTWGCRSSTHIAHRESV